MKRKLSLLLAVVMILGSFSMAFAAEEVNPAKFLEEKGILVGNESGNLMLDEPLLRKDAVVLLARLLGVEEEAENFKKEGLPTFTDLAGNPYYNAFLAWAEDNGYFTGKPNGAFGYNDNLEAVEYTLVLLRALGYVNDDKKVEWEEAWDKAKELGLLENIEIERRDEILRKDVAQMTYNALGTKMKDSDKTLAEFLGIEMPEPSVLEVEEVRADNLKEIQVKFNKDVDRDTVENVDYYYTTAGAIKDAKLVEDNTVILTLADAVAMTNKKEYKLEIKGLKDGETTINSEFKFKAYDNTVPEVVDVIGLGTKAVKVVMSEPIKEAKSSNFVIDGKTYYGSVKVAGREIILRPYGTDFGVGEHTMVVKTLEDFAGFKSVEREIKFEIAEDKEAPTVVDIKGTLERIVVTFNEDVDDATVTRDSLYWGGVKSYKADRVVRLSGNRYAFEFSKEKALPTYETVITVSGVKDYSGNEMKAQDIPFKAEIDQTRPEVLEVKVKDEKTIEVRFNKPVFKEDAEKASNYILTNEDGRAVSFRKPSLSADGRVVTIELYSALAENKEYTLKISGIRDNTKLMNTMLPWEDKISAGNYVSPTVKSVTAKNGERKIYVSFNKKMDVETIANPDNYLIVVKGTKYLLSDIGGGVDVIQDGKSAIIILPEKIGADEVEKLKYGRAKDANGNVIDNDITDIIVLGVKDTAGNILAGYGNPIEIEADKLKVLKATATDKKTVEVVFNQTVVSARTSDFDSNKTIDSVSVNGTDKVIVKLADKIKADASDLTLKIRKDNKIESVTGTYFENIVNNEKADYTITVNDGINPSLDKVEALKYGENKLELVLIFDEELNNDYANLAKSDVAVRGIKANRTVDIDVVKETVNAKIESNKLILTLTEESDIKDMVAYEIEIKDGAVALRDKIEGNVVNKTDGYVVADVDEVPVTVQSITVKTQPTKTTYTENETLDLTGLEVTLTKSDGTSEDVAFENFAAKGITTDPANGTTLTTSVTKITIKANGKTVELPITVNPITITGITVKTQPTKTTYTENETLDLTGLEVTLTKSDGTSEDVAFENFAAKGITTDPANGTTLTVETTGVVIMAGSKAVVQPITVTPVSQS